MDRIKAACSASNRINCMARCKQFSIVVVASASGGAASDDYDDDDGGGGYS